MMGKHQTSGDWWLSCSKMTVSVRTDGRGRIVAAPAIVRQFKGQSLARLCAWLERKFGQTTQVKLEE